ncbi:MAG: hypothetical protein KAF42_07855 [Sphingopyxis terrae]|nr:hypothetical protein [Sphingopyxis terrae]
MTDMSLMAMVYRLLVWGSRNADKAPRTRAAPAKTPPPRAAERPFKRLHPGQS